MESGGERGVELELQAPADFAFGGGNFGGGPAPASNSAEGISPHDGAGGGDLYTGGGDLCTGGRALNNGGGHAGGGGAWGAWVAPPFARAWASRIQSGTFSTFSFLLPLISSQSAREGFPDRLGGARATHAPV